MAALFESLRNMLSDSYHRKQPPPELLWTGDWNVYLPLEIETIPIWVPMDQGANWKLSSTLLQRQNPELFKTIGKGIQVRYSTNLDSLYPDPSAYVAWDTVITAVQRGQWLALLGTNGLDLP